MGNIPRPGTGMSNASSAITGYTDESERMDELAKVKAELEDALRQVKREMKDGGATRSQFGASTVRSSSVLSSVTGMTALSDEENWDLSQQLPAQGKGKGSKLPTYRGRAKMDLKAHQGQKP